MVRFFCKIYFLYDWVSVHHHTPSNLQLIVKHGPNCYLHDHHNLHISLGTEEIYISDFFYQSDLCVNHLHVVYTNYSDMWWGRCLSARIAEHVLFSSVLQWWELHDSSYQWNMINPNVAVGKWGKHRLLLVRGVGHSHQPPPCAKA